MDGEVEKDIGGLQETDDLMSRGLVGEIVMTGRSRGRMDL